MTRALEAALLAAGRTRPNPMVGCVIAHDERVVGVGHHACAGTAHAEIAALEEAREHARGADVYVTLEPCNHHGRTPPCTEALIRAGVARVFVGMRDPHPLVNGRGIRRLEEAGIEVKVGMLQTECRRVNEAFTHVVTTSRPFVVGKIAQSLDGRVATRTADSKWITGEVARRRGHAMRNTHDAILVGVETIRIDDPSLTCRIDGGRDPVRIILDTQARTPVSARVLDQDSDAATWIAVGEDAPEARVEALRAAGAEILICASQDGRVSLENVLVQLGQRELMSVLVEGGPTVMGALRDQGLLNKVLVFIAPMLIGGDAARSALAGMGAAGLDEALRLDIVDYEWLDADLLLTAYPCALGSRARPCHRDERSR